MTFKTMKEAGEREQKRFNKIKVYKLGTTPESVEGNAYRVMNAKRAILASYEDAESDVSSTVVDLLADLRQLCDAVGLDFSDHDRIAYNHYSFERERS